MLAWGGGGGHGTRLIRFRILVVLDVLSYESYSLKSKIYFKGTSRPNGQSVHSAMKLGQGEAGSR